MTVLVIYLDSFSMQIETCELDDASPKKFIESILARLEKRNGMKLVGAHIDGGNYIEVCEYKYFDGKLEFVSGRED